MNLSLMDAFAKFGAKPGNRLVGLSAIASDGALVLNCQQGHFGHPGPGVLRYEDRLSREAGESAEARLLEKNLTLARDGALPVRMIVTTVEDKRGSHSRRCHVRTDLIGKVTTFDGDHFVIDFARLTQPRSPAPVTHGRRK